MNINLGLNHPVTYESAFIRSSVQLNQSEPVNVRTFCASMLSCFTKWRTFSCL